MPPGAYARPGLRSGSEPLHQVAREPALLPFSSYEGREVTDDWRDEELTCDGRTVLVAGALTDAGCQISA